MFRRVVYGAFARGFSATSAPIARWNYKMIAGTCLLGSVAVGVGFHSTSSTALAEEQSTWASFKSKIMTNYENRIREYSTPEKIFFTFASVKKDGHNYMTIDDFIRALVPHQFVFKEGTNKPLKRGTATLPAAFKIADQNQDGLISYEEYLFFISLLSIPEDSFKVAFKMIDEDGSGTLDLNEFTKMMSFLKQASPSGQKIKPDVKDTMAQGWLDHYFTGGKNLTLDKFAGFLTQLKKDVLQMEFDLYSQGNKFVSQRDFGILLASYANAQNFSDFIDRAGKFNPQPDAAYSFDQFANFNKLLEHLDQIEVAMKLYQMNGRAFRKEDFQRLAKIICNTDLNPKVLETIVSIFDKNNDGTLEIDEFVTVLKRRATRGLSEPRDTGVTRGLSRFWSCLKNSEQ
eukprot:TRINITY_DN1801_c0_g1_i1.p1 TRINITY_DN1801_c0_g1~~TRINITY_DN1801_c0_g1_i1.p1  ORF type:complete len:426 (+),score=105.56 TRINITY_DN1801_c0_g1_i1:78-1280(+)